MTNDLDQQSLRLLPTTFRYGEARSVVNERRFRTLVARRLVVRINHGLYRKADASGDADLIDIAGKRPLATLCLRSALAHHDLTDDIPRELDVALPRGVRTADTNAPVAWHHFAVPTFDLGRESLALDDVTSIGLYNAERSIVDAYRLREDEGPELGNDALRRWLRRGGQPSTLLRMSTHFRKGAPALRHALEVLL